MDTRKIEQLASDFREAMEEVSKKRLYGRLSLFQKFPHGCCGYTSDLLAQYLLDNGISRESIQSVTCTTFKEGYTHCWIMLDNQFFLDITADQFNGKPYFSKYFPIPSCCFGPCGTYFYALFDSKTIGFSREVGIDYYSGGISHDLQVVYDATIQQIEDKTQRR